MRGPTAMLVLFVVVGCLMALTVYAGDPHHDPHTIAPIVPASPVNKYIAGCDAKGIASSQIDMDFGDSRLQGGLGYGHDSDCDALALGVGGRLNSSILLRMTVIYEDQNGIVDTDDYSLGAGVNWRF